MLLVYTGKSAFILLSRETTTSKHWKDGQVTDRRDMTFI